VFTFTPSMRRQSEITFTDAGAYDIAAVPRSGLVDLAERCRSDGRVAELREQRFGIRVAVGEGVARRQRPGRAVVLGDDLEGFLVGERQVLRL
jgi:hypothetical protein